jgi:glucokinase
MSDLHSLIRERIAHNHWGFLGAQGAVLGVDLGSYGLRASLIDLNHHTCFSSHQESASTEPEAVVQEAIALAQRLLRDSAIDASHLVRVGIGFPGPVDRRHGTIRLSPRIAGWEIYPLQERFESAFDAVTLIDNDANLIALGEATFGIGKSYQHVFYLHLSSGVGGGMVLDGHLYHGATSTAGEIGHAVVGRGWGNEEHPETLEELVSISGLLRRAGKLGLQTTNLEDIFNGQAVGRQIVDETTSLLATRIAQIIALLDPQMVILGGIVVRMGGNAFVDAIRQQVDRYIAPQFARPVEVVASTLGVDSVTAGALALALDSLQE